MELNFTDHARQQMQRRAIKSEWVELVAAHGQKVHKQGLVFYIALRKWLPANLSASERERIQNMVVVVKKQDNVVVTTYKNPNAMRNIRKKPKRLARYSTSSAETGMHPALLRQLRQMSKGSSKPKASSQDSGSSQNSGSSKTWW